MNASCEDCAGGGPVLDPTLEVQLSAEGPGTGQVRFLLSNHGEQAQQVLLRETAIGAGMAAFDVRLDGEPVAYTGPYAAWGPLSAQDLVRLEPGEERAASIDLTRLYDMSKPGQYSVRVLQLAGSTLLESAQGTTWAAPALNAGAVEALVSVDSEHVSVAAEEQVEKAIFQTQDPAIPPGGCTAGQRDMVVADEGQALTFLTNIVNKRAQLTALQASQLTNQIFFRDFGSSSQIDRTFVLDTYALIKANISNTIYSCGSATNTLCTVTFPGAFAVTSQPNKTTLCQAYFPPGTDQTRRAQILIHESSHQAKNGGAKDPGELFNGVKVSFPGIHTAGSYEQFAPKCTQSPGCI